MHMARHVMFMFWSIRIIRIIRLTWPADISKADLAALFSLLAKFGLLGYFTMDHLLFAKRLGFYNPSPKTATSIIGIALYGWLTELLATTSEVSIRLYNSRLLPSSQAKQTTQYTLLRLLARYLLDLPIAFHLLQYLPNVPGGVFGLCGIGSSLLSLYDTWPTPNVQPQVQVQKPAVQAKSA